MTKKAAVKSTALPRIRIDDDNGMKYVLLGTKKVWLPRAVTNKKTLRVFLNKRRKRKAAKSKKKKKRSRKVVPKVFGEASSRLIISETALRLAAQAVSNSNSNKSIDENKLAEKIEKKLLALMPPDGTGHVDTGRLIEMHPNDEVDLGGGMKATPKQILAGLKAMNHQVNRANKGRSKSDREAKIANLKVEIPKAEKEFMAAARRSLDKLKGKYALNVFLKKKAKEYNLNTSGGTKVDDLLIPVATAIMDDSDAESLSKSVEVAEDRYHELTKQLKHYEHSKSYPESNSEADVQQVAAEPESIQIEEVLEKSRHGKSASAHSPKSESSEVLSGRKHVNIYSWRDMNWHNIALDASDVGRSRLENKSEHDRERSQLGREIVHYAKSKAARLEADAEAERQMAIDDEIRGRREEENNLRFSEIYSAADIELEELRKKSLLLMAKTDNEAERDDIELRVAELRGEIEDDIQNKVNALLASQRGSGQNQDDGLSTTQINNLMKGYPDYLGCIASDEISMLNIQPHTRFGFVMNTDPHYKPGIHWVAVYVDARPGGENSIEYYNSLANQPSRQEFEDLREVAHLAHPTEHLLFKVNKIADQSNTSSNCGYFASKFLIDRFNGRSFAEASGYNHHYPVGERNIEIWKRSLGIVPFKNIDEQSGDGFRDVLKAGYNLVKKGVQRVRDVFSGMRSHASPSVRAWLEKHGNDEITAIKICRKPIFSLIEKLADLLSSGQYEVNKKELSYDRLMHLFVLFQVWDGKRPREDVKTYKIEKNHIVEIRSASWSTDNKTETVDLKTNTSMKMNDLLMNAEKHVGASKLWIYDARSQNCQYFVKWLLQSSTGWSSSVDSFVMQNAEKVLEGMGLLGKVAKVVTDVAHVADVVMNGKGVSHRRGRGGRR